MSSKSHLSTIHIAGIFGLLLLVYHLIFRDFFPLPNGRMGHDYMLTLGGFLDGFLWFNNNGFITPPWFTPSFFGGQALFADPQSAFYSIPQFLTFLVDPLQAVYWAFLLFASLGFWGMYLYSRHCLSLGRHAALIAATVFMFNGFYANRMIIGHYGYQGFMLAPLIAYLLLKQFSIPLFSIRNLTLSALAGVLIAYWFHSGLTTLMIPAALAVVALACIAAIKTGNSISRAFLARGLIAALVAIGLSASKLNANLNVMSNFGRDYYLLPGIANPLDVLRFVFQAFVYSNEHVYESVTPLWKNIQWAAMPHELAYGVTPIPFSLLLLGLGLYLLRRQRQISKPIHSRFPILPALTLSFILFLPIAMLFYSPEWNAFLKSIPIIGSTTSPFRWLILFLPSIAAATGIACQNPGALKIPLISFALIGIPLLNALESRDFYKKQDYDPAPVVAYYEALRSRQAVARIIEIGEFQAPDNAQLAQGISPLHAYNPLYGYRLEKLQTQPLTLGPIQSVTPAGTLNLRNPACFTFPTENHCKPWDAFPLTQKEDALSFASYKPFAFEKSTSQVLADTLTTLTLLAITLFLVAVAFCRIKAGTNTQRWVNFDRSFIADFLKGSVPTQFFLIAGTTTFLVFLATRWTPPNGLTEERFAAIREIFLTGPQTFWPEPSERVAYLLTISLFPALAIALNWFIGRCASGKSDTGIRASETIRKISIWFVFLLTITIVTAATERPFGMDFGFFGYVISYAIVQSPYLGLLMIGWVATLFLATNYFFSPKPRIIAQPSFSIACDIFAVALILSIAAQITFIPETAGALRRSDDLLHISPIFEPAAIAYLTNRTAGVDIASQYGGLIEFARPFLWLTDGDPRALFWFAFLSVSAACLFQWLAIRKLTAKALLALISIGALIFFTGFKYQGIACFQCVHFRWFWPSAFLMLAAYNIPAAGKLGFAPYVLFPLAIYWNPETGLASMLAWAFWRMVVNGLPVLVSGEIHLKAGELLRSFFMASAGVLFGSFLILLYAYMKSGELITPSLMFQFAKDFYVSGFYMLPMPLFNLWNIYAILAGVFLLIGISHYAMRPPGAPSVNHDFLIFSSILFALLFSYYQGRSFYGNLLAISYPLWLGMANWLWMKRSFFSNFQALLVREPLRVFAVALFCFGFSATLTTNLYSREITIPFTKQQAEEKQELAEWIDSTARGRIPFYVSLSAWRLLLITNTQPDASIQPLAAMIRRDQLSEYLEEMRKEKYAVYYDLSNESYFKVEDPALRLAFEQTISANFPGAPREKPSFKNNQGELVLLNP